MFWWRLLKRDQYFNQLLQSIQKNLLSTMGDESLLFEEKNAIAKLNKALAKEESFLKQKSRIKWLKLGDGNNSFFNQVKANWNATKILSIENAYGNLVQGHFNVAQVALLRWQGGKVAIQYFQNTLGEDFLCPAVDLSLIHCNSLQDSQHEDLLAPISNELIWKTLKRLKRNKAPGPDGFNVEFFLHTWHTVGDLFCEAIKTFFATSTLHRGTQQLFL